MPAAVAIVLADAAGTPVNHTFNPQGYNADEIFEFVDQSAANAVGFWKITVDIKQPAMPKAGEQSNGRTYRVRIGLHEPVLETVSNSTVSGIAPAPTVAYIPRAFLEFILPERTVLLDRQNIRKMAYNLLNNAQMVSVIENLERLW